MNKVSLVKKFTTGFGSLGASGLFGMAIANTVEIAKLKTRFDYKEKYDKLYKKLNGKEE